ncbi:MAG TPA: hypothetical protein VMI75_30030 [Polyangiaceae bacterium]|nr:hypothetical protein [Polyangiaceae bacterium]
MSRIGAFLVLASVPLAACMQIGTGAGDGGTTSAEADAAPVTSSEAGVDAGGTGCGTDPTSGITLCTGLNACPGLTVDQGAYGGCGFRQGGASAYDLECLCSGGQLCPIGAATSCQTALQLLEQEQSALVVCQQVATGGCLSPAASSSGGGSGSSSGGLSEECQTCVSGCGGTPACYMSCGC